MLKLNPKKMLLIDAYGAGITALLLGLVIQPFQKHFGMPVFALWLFWGIACVYYIYSLLAYYIENHKHALLLKVIAFGNSFYCLLIAFFAFRYFEKLTILGRCYFGMEIAVILGLVIVEFRTAYKSYQT